MNDTPLADGPMPESTQAKADDATPSLVGTVLSGRYRIDAELGVGGMGTVYLAEHTLMRKRLAVKVLHQHMTQLPEVVTRFEREAMAAAHIEHPNVAAATDFGKLDDGSFFLVLEFVEGVSLREVVSAGPLPVERALHIAQQIAAALVRAHGLGIVHRDLKPENVMLVERDGDADFVKVLDFGIAKVPVAEVVRNAGLPQQTLTRLGMVYGTPEYMAPEQALGQEVDARADLYALGIMLYEMLAGVRPFESDSPVTLLGLQVTQPPPPFRLRVPHLSVPNELELLTMELLEKEAARRPSDARQVLEALEQLAYLMQGNARPFLASNTRMRIPAPGSATVPALMHARGEPTTPTRPNLVLSALRDGLQRAAIVWQSVHPWISRAQAALEPHHARLPLALRRFSVRTWMAAVSATAAATLVFAGFVICRAGSPPTVTPMMKGSAWPPPALSAALAQANRPAPPGALEQATASGLNAVEELARKYPKDVTVKRTLARLYLAAGQPEKTVATYEAVLVLEPQAAQDPVVLDHIKAAAARESSSLAAFRLMEQSMGGHGADLLYDLWMDSKVPESTRRRAAAALKDGQVLGRASPALRIAIDLRNAGTCVAKRKLLDRAKEEGDRRSLVLLRGLQQTKGCGFLGLKDCWGCLRQDDLLTSTIRAIEART